MPIVVDCPEVSVTDQGLKVHFPGGPVLSVQLAELNPTPLGVAKNLLGQANAALAPLAPVFSLIDALLSVKKVIDAIPDAFGPPPNPSAIVAAIPELSTKIAALASIIPQLSVPILVVDLLDLLINGLTGVVQAFETIVEQEARILAAGAVAAQPGNSGLIPVIQCANEVLVANRANIIQGIGPLNSLIATLNLFTSLIGLPSIPPLDDLPEDASEAIDQLNTVIDSLKTLRDSIPVP